MSVRATQDEYGVVYVYRDDGSLFAFMHRSDFDQIRESLSLPPVEPAPVISGGGIVYGLQSRARGSNAK